MNIRQFKPGDTESVVALWVKCDLVVPWNDPYKDIDRKQVAGSDLFLVAEINDVLVGTVMGGYDGHRGWVNYLAVDMDFRLKGVGRRLMQELESRLLELGCPKINLQVRTSNHQVRAFYEALEYTEDKVVSYGKRLISDN